MELIVIGGLALVGVIGYAIYKSKKTSNETTTATQTATPANKNFKVLYGNNHPALRTTSGRYYRPLNNGYYGYYDQRTDSWDFLTTLIILDMLSDRNDVQYVQAYEASYDGNLPTEPLESVSGADAGGEEALLFAAQEDSDNVVNTSEIEQAVQEGNDNVIEASEIEQAVQEDEDNSIDTSDIEQAIQENEGNSVESDVAQAVQEDDDNASYTPEPERTRFEAPAPAPEPSPEPSSSDSGSSCSSCSSCGGD